MVNLRKIKKICFAFVFFFILFTFTGCLEEIISFCQGTSKGSLEGDKIRDYSVQCSSNGITFLEMDEEANNYKFIFDDIYALEKNKLKIGFKNIKGEVIDNVFTTWGCVTRPPRKIKNGELLTSIKKTLFTSKKDNVYSMCLKRNNDEDYETPDEVIVIIYTDKECDIKASFIIDDKGVNVYTNTQCFNEKELIIEKNEVADREGEGGDIKSEVAVGEVVGNADIRTDGDNGNLKGKYIGAKDIHTNFIKSESQNDGTLDEIKNMITYSNRNVNVADLDQNSLIRIRNLCAGLKIYFETEEGEVIDEPIFKSHNGDVLSGTFIMDIKKTFLKIKNYNSFSLYPINKNGQRKCRIKILQEDTNKFFYLTNADNEYCDVFFY